MPTITLRVKPKEYETMTQASERAGMPLSTFIKSVVAKSLKSDSTTHELMTELERNPELLNRLRRLLLFSAPQDLK